MLVTVHDPHPDIAARDITQEYVAFHVGADDDPIRRQLSNDSRLQDLRTVHEPDADVALIVHPEDVGLAVAIEVSGTGDRPVERDRAEAAALYDLCAVHQPHADIADGVAPENVALAVAIEVALADD